MSMRTLLRDVLTQINAVRAALHKVEEQILPRSRIALRRRCVASGDVLEHGTRSRNCRDDWTHDEVAASRGSTRCRTDVSGHGRRYA